MKVAWKDIDAAMALLAETYPQCFTHEQYLPHRPLKVGIDHDLAERCPALSHRERGLALQFYTSRIMYLPDRGRRPCRSRRQDVWCCDRLGSRTRPLQDRRNQGCTRRRGSCCEGRQEGLEGRYEDRPPGGSNPAPPASEPLPAASPAPANSVVKLKDRPVLTLPAFRKVKEAVS